MGGVPKLSHLQFLILGILRGGERAGRELRDGLKTFGIRKGGPAFYQLMARMEDGGLVVGTYHQEVVDGQILRERHYRSTAAGMRGWEASRAFYQTAIQALGEGGEFAGA